MRKVLALILSVVMVMSLLVVAGADTAVTLSIEPQPVAQGATVVLFDIYLDPNGPKEIGAFQFSVSGQGCTIIGSQVTGIDDKGDPFIFNEETGEGSFAYFGGALNDGVYTFVAAGTAKTGTGNHFWNATAKAKIVTLKATIESGASECKLIVDQESDKQFSVGYDNGSGVQPLYAVNVDSRAANLSGGGILVESVTVSGTATSFNSDTGDVTTIQLIESGASEPAYEAVVKGNTASYSIAGVAPGTYTMKVMKQNHVTREYTVTVGSSNVVQDVKICLLGDVTGDGKVNAKDHSRLYAHVNKTNLLTGYELLCADVTGDGKVNAKDHSRLYAHISKTNPLW